MWKALIELIKSKAYRCEHEWERINETEFYTETSKMPVYRKFAYRCTKCCESKIIKV